VSGELPVKLSECDEGRAEQEWIMEEGGRLRHVSSAKCLDVVAGLRRRNRTALVADCSEGPGADGQGGRAQRWIFRSDHHLRDI